MRKIDELLNGAAWLCFMAGDDDGGDDKAGGGGGGGTDKGGDDAGTSGDDKGKAGDAGGRGRSDLLDSRTKDEGEGEGEGEGDKSGDDKSGDGDGDRPERPDWLTDDKFWDAEKGEVKAQELFKNLKHFQGKVSDGEGNTRPDSPDGYKVDLKVELAQALTMVADDGKINEDDPLLKGLREDAHEAGLTQAEFSGVLNGMAQRLADLIGPPHDPQAEIAKLGKNGQALIDSQAAWRDQMVRMGVLNDRDVEELRVLTSTAEGVRTLQKIREFYDGDVRLPTDLPSDPGLPGADELREMLNSEKYQNNAAYRQHVDEMYAKRYGRQPEGVSRIMAR